MPIYLDKKDKSAQGKEFFFNDNYFRKRIWDEDTKFIKPDKKYIDEYKEFLIKAYKSALRKQLNISGPTIYGGYKKLGRGLNKKGEYVTLRKQVRSKRLGLGFATGKLKDSIEADAKVSVDFNPKKGRADILYRIEASYEQYGDYISRGRSAGGISPYIIVKWIKQKISNGVMYVDKGNRKNEEEAITSFAFGIANQAAKSNKPPVIPNWSEIDKNKKLSDAFNKENRGEGARIRRNMRNNVLSKMRRRYGKK